MPPKKFWGAESLVSTIIGQGHEAVVVGTELANMGRLLYVGTGGDVTLMDQNGTALEYKNVPSGGTIGPLAFKKVTAVSGAANMISIF